MRSSDALIGIPGPPEVGKFAGRQRVLAAVASVTLVLCGCAGTQDAAGSGTGDNWVGPRALASQDVPSFRPGATLAKNGPVNPDASRVVLHKPSSKKVSALELDAAVEIGQVSTLASNANSDWSVVGCGDFDKDGESDVLWQNKNSRALAFWRMKSLQVVGATALPTPSVGWKLIGVGDLNDDGSADVIWQKGGR